MDSHKKKLILIPAFTFLGAICLGLLTHYFFKLSRPEEFRTLTAIQKYALSLPEFPPADNQDWENPQFSEFYKSRHPSIFGKALHFLGLGKRSPWSLAFMAELIKTQTKYNHAQGLIDGQESIIHIKAQESTRVLVFGDMHASFHSLVRDLLYLREKGSLTDELKITNNHLFFVFNGDFIDRSPHNIDSLILLTMLMGKNPNQVIYVAGNHERDRTWNDYSLKQELISRGQYFSEQNIPFDNEIMAFFASLPSAVYLSGSQDKKEVIRISFFSRNKLSYDENKLNPLFLEQSSQLKIINVKDQRPSKDKIDIRASIETEEWRRSKRIKNGMGLLDQDRGATTWAVLSSPTLVNRFYLDFHQDAFAAIDINQLVRDATITNIHRDIRKTKKYSVEDSLNVATGRPAHEAIPVSIKIGSTMSLVRGVPTTGKQIKSGLSARMNEYNRSLKAAERNIRLYVDNDNYNPQFARKNMQKFLDLGINFFIIPVGTPTLYSYLDLIEKNQAVVFFPNTGAASLRAPQFTNLIHFRASYDDEARVLIRELKHQYGATKFAFLYQDDAFGKEPLKAAILELEKLGITDYLALPYTRGSVNFANQVRAMKNFSPNALGFFATGTATKEFIRQMGVNDLLSMNLFAISFTAESQLRRFLKNKGLSMLFGCFLPNPFIGAQPIGRAYREAMERDSNIMGIQSFEAYFATSLFIHALNQIDSPKPRPQELLKVFEKMKNTNFEGVDLNFNPATRSLAKDVYIENGDGNLWKKYNID